MEYKVIMRAFFFALLAAGLCGCQKVETIYPETLVGQDPPSFVTVEDVARLLAGVPVGQEQMQEVHTATLSSVANGYDEEYRMQDLLTAPGTGVGDQPTKAGQFTRPLRDLLREALTARSDTKAGDVLSEGEVYLDSLMSSDVQIYWPYSASWDGTSLPVVTFDPGDFAVDNVGFALQADGSVKKVLVTESMARERPVWVVNRNADAQYKSLELLRREDPDWGTGSGDLVVKPRAKDASQEMKTLILRSFKAKRQYDNWFSGGSEFFVKLGSVDDFQGLSTDAELRTFNPSITDFMIVVRRGQVGEEIPFNAVLVSEWKDYLESCAFLVIEDDGGTVTTWKCAAMVKYNSRSYGFEIEIPVNSRDDIVWRGALTRRYIERYSGTVGHFGDVDLVLELI